MVSVVEYRVGTYEGTDVDPDELKVAYGAPFVLDEDG